MARQVELALWQDLEREQGIEAALRQRLAIWRQAGLKKLWKNIVNLAIDGHQEPGVPEKNDICLIIHIIT